MTTQKTLATTMALLTLLLPLAASPTAADPGDRIRSSSGTLLPRSGIPSLLLPPVPIGGVETPDTPPVNEQTVGPFGENEVTLQVHDRTIGTDGYLCVDLVVDGQQVSLVCESHERLDQFGIRHAVPRMVLPILPAGPVTTPGVDPMPVADVDDTAPGDLGRTPLVEIEVTRKYFYDCESMPAHTIVAGVPVREPVGLDPETLQWVATHGQQISYHVFVKVWMDGQPQDVGGLADLSIPFLGQAAGYQRYVNAVATDVPHC